MRGRAMGMSMPQIALLFGIVGCLIAIAAPTIRRELRHSKTSEAAVSLQSIADAARVYYSASHPQGKRCIPTRAGPTPANLGEPRTRMDFAAMPGGSTWQALSFQPGRHSLFRYTFEPSQSGCNLPNQNKVLQVLMRAEADLDADGHLSRYELIATIDPDGVWHMPKTLLVAYPYE